MLVESHHLLASGEPRDKYIPLLSTVSVSPTHSSQNFCIDKHFILSIDSKHTLKWLAEEELLCPYLIQYLPLHKLKNPLPLNYREKGQNTTSHMMWQIPIPPSFPVHFGLSSPPSVNHLVQSHHLWHGKDPCFSWMHAFTCGERAPVDKISANSLCISWLETQSSFEPCGNCPKGYNLEVAFLSWQAERTVFIEK